MHLMEVDSPPHWSSEGMPFEKATPIDDAAEDGKTDIDKLPNEVLFNIFEKLQDDKSLLFNCLCLQRRWYNLALPHLWNHFEFSLGNKRDLRQLQQLVTDEHVSMCFSGEQIETINPNFTLVRSLFLSVNLCGERINDAHDCAGVSRTINKFITLLKSCTNMRYLRLDVRPFLPINASIAAWPTLANNNALLLELVQQAGVGAYGSFFLDASLPKWQYEESSSLQIRAYLKLLAPQITRLHLVDTASTAWSSIEPFSRLRSLEFENIGNAGTEACSAFWDVLESMPLEDLGLSSLIFPRYRKFENWQNLRSLRLNQFGEIEATVSKVLSSFPNLRTVAFHNPLHTTENTPVNAMTDIACVSLRKIVFTHCRAQPYLLSHIAKACPQLQICMPPDNASDLDIVTLIDYCPNLTVLLIDCCTDLTSVSIQHIPRAERLRSLLFNFQHLFSLDEECILALAENCPDLRSRGFRIATMDYKNEKHERVLVREHLSGEPRLRDDFENFRGRL